MPMVRIELETGKNVDLSAGRIQGWGEIIIIVRFVELEIEREYSLDSEQLRSWLQANPTKTWRDYAKMVLLPLYNRLLTAKQIRDGLT